MITKKISSEQTHSLRHSVLWPHILKTEDCIIDIDNRKDAIHLGIFNNQGYLISICSLFEQKNSKINEGKQYRLRAMATDKNYRGLNAGKKLVEYAIEILKSKDIDFLWCDARKVATGFYEKIGFETKGDWYEIKNVGLHKTMVFTL